METKIKEVCAEHFKNRSRADLSVFVTTYRSFIIENSPTGTPLEKFWTTAYEKSAKELGVLTKSRTKTIDWGSIALEVLEKKTALSEASSSSRGTKRSSKCDLSSLSASDKKALRDWFQKLNDKNKWRFTRDDGSDAFVEDMLVKYAEECDFEHCSFSLIFDVDDPTWKQHFSKLELQQLCAYGNPTMPSTQKCVQEILDGCHFIVEKAIETAKDYDATKEQKFIVDSLSEYLNQLGPFDPYDQFDEHWLLATLHEICLLYRWNIPSRMSASSSEMDFVVKIWSQLDKCFHGILVDARRDVSCTANLARLNNDRRVDGKKPIADQIRSARPDLLLSKNDIELGLGECGKNDFGGIGKKEIMETQLHGPKLMKDVFLRAVDKTNKDPNLIRKLQVVCFNQTCFRMSLSIMDCPAGVVCRIRETEEYEFPKHISLFSSGIVPIVQLTLKAKMIIKESIAMIEEFSKRRGLAEPGYNYQCAVKAETIDIPPCFTPSVKKPKSGGSSKLVTEDSV